MLRTVLVAAVIIAGITAALAQTDILTALGTNLREAQDSIFSSLATGIASPSGDRQVFKSASAEQRAVMVRAVMAIARTFAASDEFARRYALYRQSQQPRRSSTARTGEEARTQQQQAIELAVKQAMANAAQLPAEARKQLEESIAEMRKQIADLNADASYRAQIDQAAAAAAQEDDVEFARQLAIFTTEFPEQVDALIARRLRQFLLACGEVDFAAKLEAAPDKKLRFVNAAYERRSPEWKMCYRAGKPAVDAARRAAEDWLKGLTEKGF